MRFIVLLLFACVFTQELEVEGDLKVTGTIQNDSLAQVIANLQAQITALQQQIAQLECINNGNIPAGYCDCFGNVKDICGVCGGDAISEAECIVTDFDGNIYETVLIGDQVWMAENLKVTHYRDGDPLISGMDLTNEEWELLGNSDGAYIVYNNDIIYSEIYGNLYNWYAVTDSRGLCMDGWHIPSDEEWKNLEFILGMSYEELDEVGFRGTIQGGKLKEEGHNHWEYYSDQITEEATNEYYFNAIPAGYKDALAFSTAFHDIYINVHFWCSDSQAVRRLDKTSSAIDRQLDKDKDYGFSVRCIKN